MAKPFKREWHDAHRLGVGASPDDRVAWHLEHAKVCGCRPIPAGVLEEIQRGGIAHQP